MQAWHWSGNEDSMMQAVAVYMVDYPCIRLSSKPAALLVQNSKLNCSKECGNTAIMPINHIVFIILDAMSRED